MGVITHFVFVDFENVPKVDLAPVAGKSVHVTLLIGKKQTKLDTTLSLQLNKFSDQVDPVHVDASGRNALDMILAGYLGQAVERHPGAHFHIVSKDQDFEPLMAHLQSKGVQVSRHDAFAALPFLASSRKTPAQKPTTPTKPKAPDDKYLKLLDQIKSGKNRPGTRAKLMHHIHTVYGQKTSPEQQTEVIIRLADENLITIDEKDRVRYS